MKDVIRKRIIAPCVESGHIGILDGGFATHLEDALHCEISSSPLWSASLLNTPEGCEAIKKTHLDFIKAGADIFSTSTYQVSQLAMKAAGYSAEDTCMLLRRAVEIAVEAREIATTEVSWPSERSKPLLSLSLGPYGAALANGAEYTGVYLVPGTKGKLVSAGDLMSFHYDRLEAIATDRNIWDKIDIIAFETIPCISEVTAIRSAIAKLHSSYPSIEEKISYASFVFPIEDSLDVPIGKESAAKGTAECFEALVDSVFGSPSLPKFDGIGINCTKPHITAKIVPSINEAVAARTHSSKESKPFLFLYPDGGLVWNGTTRQWTGGDHNFMGNQNWANMVFDTAKSAIAPISDENERVWAACFVGGCCKSSADDILNLHHQRENLIARSTHDNRNCNKQLHT